jgi:hypothetical protein
MSLENDIEDIIRQYDIDKPIFAKKLKYGGWEVPFGDNVCFMSNKAYELLKQKMIELAKKDNK